MIGDCTGASAPVYAPVCAPGAGEGWREGEGYEECLRGAASALARVREREVLRSSRASCAFAETLGARPDRRGGIVRRSRW